MITATRSSVESCCQIQQQQKQQQTRKPTIKRRLWMSPEDDNIISSLLYYDDGTEYHTVHSNSATNNPNKDDDVDVDDVNSNYECLFAKFSVTPPPKPLSLLLWQTIHVGQEFVLACILLAGHRKALLEEEETTAAAASPSSSQSSMNCTSSSYTNNNNNNNNNNNDYNNTKVPMITLFAFGLIWFTLLISVWMTSFVTSQQYQFWHRMIDFGFLAIGLRFFAAVLQSVTASYSSNTVYILSIALLLLHIVTCNYAYANGEASLDDTEKEEVEEELDNDDDDGNDDDEGIQNHVANVSAEREQQQPLHRQRRHLRRRRKFRRRRPLFKGGTISLTSALFATTLLASRLQNNVTVYLFVCFSVILFALYPATRHYLVASVPQSQRRRQQQQQQQRHHHHPYLHHLRTTIIPIINTLILTLALLLLLENKTEIMILVLSILVVIMVFIPLWKYHLQHYKLLLRGPWDIAHV